MVPGWGEVATWGDAVSQWAEMHRIASGLPSSGPSRRRKSPAGTGSSGSVGAPCETKRLGKDFMALHPFLGAAGEAPQEAPADQAAVPKRRARSCGAAK